MRKNPVSRSDFDKFFLPIAPPDITYTPPQLIPGGAKQSLLLVAADADLAVLAQVV